MAPAPERVWDPFIGSGTTLIASERQSRVCYGTDVDPGYIDVTIRRWQALTGAPALRASDGVTFESVAEK